MPHKGVLEVVKELKTRFTRKTGLMKAVVFNGYGGNDVVEIKDVPRPVPQEGDVLIRVHAACVNPIDWKIRSGMMRNLTGESFPKILGVECSGEVVETGSSAMRYKKGDQVIARADMRRLGTFAEYAAVPEITAYPKSGKIPYEEAACFPVAAITALQALRDSGRIAFGKKVLINGAAGGVGHFAVQIAKIFGAEVVAVCSAAKADMAGSLGADRVIDYTKDDFTKGSAKYDLIFDAVGKSSFAKCENALAPKGIYVSTLGVSAPSGGTDKKAVAVHGAPNSADIQWLTAQREAGKLRVVIGRTFTIAQAKAALADSESERAQGKIVLKIV